MPVNLRADDVFAKGAGWHAAAAGYEEFFRRHQGQHVSDLELGAGGNPPEGKEE